MLSVDEQMRIITSGAAQIVPEADLRTVSYTHLGLTFMGVDYDPAELVVLD